ncbi:hypothetical protein AB6A40_004813 [Gnathostoma spinigerum]|uniref:Protein kinase domain-containing protein n=1 Tax=Gnathostoma spinigerum TaxID=75299 RepID=A0ABD6EDM7_9BILA
MGAHGSVPSSDVQIGEEVSRSSSIYRVWTDVASCVTPNGDQATIFSRKFKSTDSKDIRSFFENGIKIARQIRHPYVVKYIDSRITDEEAVLITERVQILDIAIDSLSPIEIHTGLITILNALVFLHSKAGLCHNNVCPSSVFVTSDKRWKLCGFECAQKAENIEHWVQSDFVRSIKEADFAPPEDKLMLAGSVPPTARDSFAFGKLILFAVDLISDCDSFSGFPLLSLKEVASQLTSENPSVRGELSSFLENPAFSNDVTSIDNVLRTIHSQSDSEKDRFFSDLVDRLRLIPQEIVANQLVPVLLSRYVLLERRSHHFLLPTLLRPLSRRDESDSCIGILNPQLYRMHIIPQILKILRVHEVSVRLNILAHFGTFVQYLSINELENVVLKELKASLLDTDDRLVSASLCALADVVPILGGAAVTERKHVKSFADGTPKVHDVHTSVCHTRRLPVSPISLRLDELPELESISPTYSDMNDTVAETPPGTSSIKLRLLSESEQTYQDDVSNRTEEDRNVWNWEEESSDTVEEKTSTIHTIHEFPNSESGHESDVECHSVHENITVCEKPNSPDSVKQNITESHLGTMNAVDLKYRVPNIGEIPEPDLEDILFAEMEPVIEKKSVSLEDALRIATNSEKPQSAESRFALVVEQNESHEIARFMSFLQRFIPLIVKRISKMRERGQ